MLLNRRPKFFRMGVGVPMNHTLGTGCREGCVGRGVVWEAKVVNSDVLVLRFLDILEAKDSCGAPE